VSEGLRPRPAVPDDVAAAIAQAVEQVIASERDGSLPEAPWRFSGRWFTAHPIRMRGRPG
jgi:hypothetical protein